MFDVQIFFNGRWHTLVTGFTSRDAADWEIGRWRQANNCPTRDGTRTFRVIERGQDLPD